MTFDFEKQTDVLHLSIDDRARAHFFEIIRWGRFLGILSAVMTILFSVMLLLALSVQSTLAGIQASGSLAGIIIGILFFIGIYFYPIYALIQFGSYIRNGLNNQNQEEFNRGLKMLGSFFKYIGILAIILIVLYGIIFMIALAVRPS